MNVQDIDALTMKTKQLSALLKIVTGDGLEHFDNCNEDIKHHYLWMCSTLSDEIDLLSQKVS